MVDPTRLRGLWRRMIPWQDRGAVTFRRQTAAGAFTDTAVSDAWFRQGGVVEAESSQGAYLLETLVWYVPREMLPAQPLVGDRVANVAAQKDGYPLAGREWVVGKKGGKAVNAEGVWEMEAVRPFINPGRVELVDIYRPQPGVSDRGMLTKGTPTKIADQLPVAVQVSDTFGIVPVHSQVGFDKFQTPIPVRVYFDGVLLVQPKDYLIRADGTQLTCLNHSNVERVGEFQAIDCQINS